ncbi:MAG: hypothetical protein K6D03_02020 [Solobacterium sp.]|nr:hypothetical protein [Solobacterium sp.]
MNQTQKFTVNEGILLLAYAYAFSDYTEASVFFGALALILCIWFHSAGVFMRRYFAIAALSLVQILLIRSSHMNEVWPSLSFLAFCNSAYSVMWMDSSYKSVRKVTYGAAAVMLGYLLTALILPDAAVQILMKQSGCRPDVLIGLIFLPHQACFLAKYGKRECMTLKRRICSLIINPVERKDCSYDGMASQAVCRHPQIF